MGSQQPQPLTRCASTRRLVFPFPQYSHAPPELSDWTGIKDIKSHSANMRFTILMLIALCAAAQAQILTVANFPDDYSVVAKRGMPRCSPAMMNNCTVADMELHRASLFVTTAGTASDLSPTCGDHAVPIPRPVLMIAVKRHLSTPSEHLIEYILQLIGRLLPSSHQQRRPRAW